MKDEQRWITLLVAGLLMIAALMPGCDGLTGSDEVVYSSVHAVGTRYFPIIEGLHTRTTESDVGGLYHVRGRFIGPARQYRGMQSWPVTRTKDDLPPLPPNYFGITNDTLFAYEVGEGWVPMSLMIALETAEAGDTLVLTGYGDYKSWTILTSKNEFVAVPAGNYSHCAMTFSYRPPFTTWKISEPHSEVRTWYAPGVGVVKSIETYFDSKGQVIEQFTLTKELIEFSIEQE